jgi:hypothetical protein
MPRCGAGFGRVKEESTSGKGSRKPRLRLRTPTVRLLAAAVFLAVGVGAAFIRGGIGLTAVCLFAVIALVGRVFLNAYRGSQRNGI